MAKQLKLGTKSKVIQLETPLQRLVDRLGVVHEQLRLLIPEEKKLKDELKAKGPGVFEGHLFTATSEARIRAYYKAELLRLKVDPDILEECEVKSPYLEIKPVRKVPLQLGE